MFTLIARERDVVRTLGILGAVLICTGCGSGALDLDNGDLDRNDTGEQRASDAGDDAVTDAAQDARASCDSEGAPQHCDSSDVRLDAARDVNDGSDATLADIEEDTAAPSADIEEDTAVETPVCGDGVIEGDEQCDDRGTAADDGCSPNCKIESGYRCSGSPSDCSPAPSSGSGDAQCEPTYGSGVYDAFPGNNGSYPKGNSSTYGWPGDDFESYAHDEIVESRTNQSRRSHLDVTSGTLRARHLNGSRLWKRGWTDTYNFRVLSRATSGGKLVRLTDVDPAVRVHISNWDTSGPQWSGAHIFARYQTENDLYVASLRKDGKVYIKLKHCDAYTTLAGADFSQGPVQTGTWYDLRFEVVGQRLRFYVDGHLELEAFDDTLSWGTTGVRTDYATMYLDDWKHR